MSDDTKEDIDKNLMKDHEYDGIRELDNPLPDWWLATFYGTIIFAAIYMIHYMVAGGPTLDDELKQDLAAIQSQQQEAAAAAPSAETMDVAALLKDEQAIADGQSQFKTLCSSCHGDQGQGGIGPNLTDKYWIHGGQFKDIVEIIKNGVQDKGMPPWDQALTPEKVRNVAAYILSIKDSNPPNPKEPQGELIEE